MQAIVNFRTMRNGAYKFIKAGQKRGYWRVLVVHDPKGPTTISSRNVVECLYEGPAGLLGVGRQSNYNIEASHTVACNLANEWNAKHA